MALFKNRHLMTVVNDAAFDAFHEPASMAPHPGIYRCTACGDEVAVAAGQLLPPLDHRDHNLARGPVQWQLLVYPIQQPAALWPNTTPMRI